ncbi:MAG: SGNH/GDSL hydrolase family protein [Opitutaceae bacterium]|nr:SGNH/GDSL hydrolase family protein [Opitutaceae bacterium]
MPPLRHFLRLTIALALLGTAARIPAEPAAFEAEVSALQASLQSQPIAPGAIAFAGSSSIRLWTSLPQDFPSLRTVNIGFGGAKINEVIQFAPRLLLPLKPRQVVFYCGTNDLADGESPEVVLADFKAFVSLVRETVPEVQISFISTAPNPARWHLVSQMRRFNESVAAWIATQPRMDYIDVFHPMLGEDGQPRPELFSEDRLHMNATGYALWRELVLPYLSPEK